MSHYRDPVSRDCFKVRKGLCVTGDTHLIGDLVITGNLTLSGTGIDEHPEDHIPSLHDTYVIGSDQFRWAEVNAMYLSISGNAGISNNLTIGNNTNIHNNLTVDGNTLLGGELVVYDDVYLDKGATWATGGTLSSDSVFATVRSNSACWQVACGSNYVIQPTLSTYCYVPAPSAYNPVGLHYTSSSHTISVDETNTYASDRISDINVNTKTLTLSGGTSQPPTCPDALNLHLQYESYTGQGADIQSGFAAFLQQIDGGVPANQQTSISPGTDKLFGKDTFYFDGSSTIINTGRRNDGAYDAVSITEQWNALHEGTNNSFIEFYIKPEASTATDVLFATIRGTSAHVGVQCVRRPDGSIQYDIFTGVQGTAYKSFRTPPGSIELDKWQHVIIHFDKDTEEVNIYIDGTAQVDQNNSSYNVSTAATGYAEGTLVIGAGINSTGNMINRYHGHMADFGVWFEPATLSTIDGHLQKALMRSGNALFSCGNSSPNMANRYPVGARVLVITTYAPDGGDETTVGNWEFAEVADHTSDGVVLKSRLSKTYHTSNYTFIANPSRYNNLTIASGVTVSTTPWIGSATELQGVTILAANNLTIEGSVDATESGFRGGNIAEIGANDGGRGESYVAGIWNAQARAAAYGAGGGGAYDNRGSQGDAGGQGGSGGNRLPGDDGNGWSPGYGGAAIIDSTGDKIFMGPGGGQGGGDDAYPSDTQPGRGGFGGAGGGIIILDSLNLTINGGDVNVGPQTGQISNDPGDGEPGDGGSGAGGTVVITGNVDNQGTITGADSRGSVFIFGTDVTPVDITLSYNLQIVGHPNQDINDGTNANTRNYQIVENETFVDETFAVDTFLAGPNPPSDWSVSNVEATYPDGTVVSISVRDKKVVPSTSNGDHELQYTFDLQYAAPDQPTWSFIESPSTCEDTWVGGMSASELESLITTVQGSSAGWGGNLDISGLTDDVNDITTVVQTNSAAWTAGGSGSGLVNWTETNGHIIPNSNAAYDLGNAEYKVRHLFLSDNSIRFVNDADEVTTFSVAGTPTSGQQLTFDSTLEGYRPIDKTVGNTWMEDNAGHLIPAKNETFDLGSTEKKIRHIHIKDGSMWMGDNKISAGKSQKRNRNVVPHFFTRRGTTENDIASSYSENYGDGSTLLPISGIPDWYLVSYARQEFSYEFGTVGHEDASLTFDQIFPVSGIDYSASDYEYILDEKDTASANTTVATNSASWGSGGITIVGTPTSGQRLAYDSTLDGYKPVEIGNYWSEDGAGNLIPNETQSYDLGSDAKRIRHLYLQDGSMWVGDSKVQSGKSMKRDINAHPWFFERRGYTEAQLLQWAWDNYGLYGNAEKGIAQGTQFLSVSSVPTWMMVEVAVSEFGSEFGDQWMYVTLSDIFPADGIDFSANDYEYILEESDTSSANTTVATNSAFWGQGGSGGSSVASCSAGVFVTDIKGYASIGDNNETGNCTVEHEDTVAAYSNSKPAISATTDQTVIGFDLIWNGPPDQWVGIPEVSGYAVSMSDVTKLNSYTRAFKASIQIDFNGYAGQLVTIPYSLDDDHKSVSVQFAGAPPEITNMTISDYPTYSGVQQDHFKSGDDIDITIEFDQNDVSSVRFQGNVTGSTSRSVTVVSNSATVTVPCATTLHGTGNLENISAYATNALGTEGNGYTTSSDIPVMRGPQITNMTVGAYPGSQTELKNNDKITITCEFDTMNVDRMVFSGQGWSNGSDQTKTTTVSNMSASAEFTINNSSITTGNEYEFYMGAYKNGHHTGHFEYDSGTYVSDAFMNGQTIIINNQGPTYGGFNVVYPDNTGSGGYAQQALKNTEDADVTITASNVGANPTYQYSSNGQLSIPDQAYSATKTVSRISNSTGWNDSSYNYTLQVTRAENDKTTQTSLVVKIADTNPQITVTPNNNNRMQSGGNDGTTIKDHNIRMNSDQPLLQAPTLTAPHGDLTAFSWSSGTETFNATMSVSDNYNKGVHTWGALEAVNLAGRVVTNITGNDTYEFGGFRSRDVTLVAFTNETTIDVLWTDYNKINLTWRVPTPGGGYQTMSLPTRAAAGTSAEPPTAGAWCMAEASPTAHPVTIRILDISQAGAVSQDSLITIEEVA